MDPDERDWLPSTTSVGNARLIMILRTALDIGSSIEVLMPNTATS